MKYYYKTPDYCVALNPKVGSSSLARAIIRAYQPKEDWLIKTAAYPEGKSESTRQWHSWCKGTRTPDKPVVLLVRDPVERFISACQQVGLKTADVDAAIESLEKDTPIKALADRKRRRRRGRPGHLRDNAHFEPQCDCADGDTQCYRFPDHLPQVAELLGLGELPQANAAKREKPMLTKSQEARVRAIYAEDAALFSAIQRPGHKYRKPTSKP